MNKHSQRKLFAQALVEMGERDARIVALEADLSGSTMSSLFAKAHPARYFEMGIAEANMAGWAAGLALGGYIPFLHTFAVFAAGRMYDQLRVSVCYPNLPVRVIGASAGLSDFADGASHQAVEDMALMRALPHMAVFCPADGYQAQAIATLLASWPGPAYVRLNRNDTPIVTQPGETFIPGQATVMCEGKDVLILATGIMVSRALEAAGELACRGISAGVANVASIDPLDLSQIASLAAGMRGVIVAQEHVRAGGLSELVAPALSPMGMPIRDVCIGNGFGQSARDYGQLLSAYGLTKEAIVKAALSCIME